MRQHPDTLDLEGLDLEDLALDYDDLDERDPREQLDVGRGPLAALDADRGPPAGLDANTYAHVYALPPLTTTPIITEATA